MVSVNRLQSLALLLSVACGSAPERTTVLPFDSVFATDVIIVHEDETDLVVAPRVRAEPDGFLYADFTEARIRRYHRDGRLDWATGGKGGGPGEYERPSDVVRVPDGRVLVFEYNGRMTVLSPRGDSVLEIKPGPFRVLEEVEVIDGSRLLVAGDLLTDTPGDPQRSTLHVWDWARDTVLTSFFRPFATTPHTDLVHMASWVRADIRADTIAAIHAAADTVFLMSVEGEPLGTIPIPVINYIAPTPPPTAARTDMNARREWLGSFHLISEVEWLDNGDVIVGYRRQIPDEPAWSAIVLRRGSGGATQIDESGRLLSAGPNSELLFTDPSSLMPGRWIVGTVR